MAFGLEASEVLPSVLLQPRVTLLRNLHLPPWSFLSSPASRRIQEEYPHMKKKLLSAVVLCALGFVGCGDDSDGGNPHANHWLSNGGWC